ncbi:sensor histidine kinase [Niabella hibiscisoli]|uniref:sensor histidine kinase n=1 Tax=Niabella hibiscisoli TaxID=1825928 RepID=UPI001F0E6791|nr:HAMP domain-containing sensor histidine kinase [Niabella hibiscisoli]MCH5719514.1 HAMP domain-containing histidine kinase [Niabella hibiscisoli]
MNQLWPGLLIVCIVLTIFIIYLYRQLKLARNRIRLLEALDQEKDKLFTVIGHDLNNFVGMGHAGLQLYRSGSLPVTDGQLILDGIEEKFYTTSVTLQSLLNWGKSVFKGVAIRQTAFDAAALISAELDLAKTTIKNKDLGVENTLASNLVVYADPDHVKFIIRNLLSNAIKFSRGGGAIALGGSVTTQKDFAVIAVRDSGVGMSEGQLRKVFYPFGSSTEGTAKEKGNGIGLMLCREYARTNGGDLWAESTDGIGTTFYLAVKTYDHNRKYLHSSNL